MDLGRGNKAWPVPVLVGLIHPGLLRSGLLLVPYSSLLLWRRQCRGQAC